MCKEKNGIDLLQNILVPNKKELNWVEKNVHVNVGLRHLIKFEIFFLKGHSKCSHISRGQL